MQFRISRASDREYWPDEGPCKTAFQKKGSEDWWVEIQTLEELLALQDSVDEDLILEKDRNIIVYDTYIE